MNKIKTAIPMAAIIAVMAFTGNAQARNIKQPAQYDDRYDDNYNGDEEYCREYTQTFSIGGERETGYGTACLQPDGSWKIVSQEDKDDKGDESSINYVVREETVYVQPREIIFAPGHRWHRRPVTIVRGHYGRPYPPYGHYRGHGHRHH